jgi:hypothetical protein
MHCTQNPIYVFPEIKLRGFISNSYMHMHFIYSQDWSAYLAAANRQIWVYLNLSQIRECGHYNFVLEITRPHIFILGIHKSELNIYIGFSPALHLQCER